MYENIINPTKRGITIVSEPVKQQLTNEEEIKILNEIIELKQKIHKYTTLEKEIHLGFDELHYQDEVSFYIEHTLTKEEKDILINFWNSKVSVLLNKIK